jgi:ABC-type polar amino acid transport system ATPase subunit
LNRRIGEVLAVLVMIATAMAVVVVTEDMDMASPARGLVASRWLF